MYFNAAGTRSRDFKELIGGPIHKSSRTVKSIEVITEVTIPKHLQLLFDIYERHGDGFPIAGSLALYMQGYIKRIPCDIDVIVPPDFTKEGTQPLAYNGEVSGRQLHDTLKIDYLFCRDDETTLLEYHGTTYEVATMPSILKARLSYGKNHSRVVETLELLSQCKITCE